MSLPFWHLNQQQTLQRSVQYTFEMAIVFHDTSIVLDSEVGAVLPSDAGDDVRNIFGFEDNVPTQLSNYRIWKDKGSTSLWINATKSDDLNLTARSKHHCDPFHESLGLHHKSWMGQRLLLEVQHTRSLSVPIRGRIRSCSPSKYLYHR